MTDHESADTTAGRVRGSVRDGVAAYLGVPYAAPPVGDLRFAEPEPALPWIGVRDALVPGPSAPQGALAFPGIDTVPITGPGWRRGDDYLTLNVWAPVGAERRPVLVYVHGGGLVLGSKDAAVHDGRAFARDGAVVVAVNYRLGVEGFVAVPGAPTNLGLRDVLAALRWVRANIAAFGGDAENVTLFGESGGGIAVSALVTSPLSVGLFGRAIVQSGHGSAVYPVEIAHRVTHRLASTLGVAPDRDGFRAVDPEALVTALRKAARPGAVSMRDESGFDPSFGLGVVNPVVGDDVLPVHPLDALRAGAGREVDLLIGTTEDEANSWFAPYRLLGVPAWAARLALGRLVPRGGDLFRRYREEHPGLRGGEVLSRVLGDLSFRLPARRYAAAHRGRTHFFEFDWRSPASRGRLGAAHGVDLGFVFDTLPSVSGPRGMVGEDPPQALADHVHRTWLRFATDGTADWPEYSDAAPAVSRLFEGRVEVERPLPAAGFLPG
ncbi:carboxylesterase/lipase family protein [Umezawaea sp.]|uniref:carboxylesterase/lipase family protein n=1 Tax=Umezawaea sp. TaxID=1955258 RepID=UPI002ED68E6F